MRWEPREKTCLHCGVKFKHSTNSKDKSFCSLECRTSGIATMQEYRKTHSLQETVVKFGVRKGWLHRAGVWGVHKLQRESCPDCLSPEQHEVFVGNMLGDGSLMCLKSKSVERKNSRLSVEQKITRRGYVEWLAEVYQPFTTLRGVSTKKQRIPIFINGKISHAIEDWDGRWSEIAVVKTSQHKVFTTYREKWYAGDTEKSPKIIPQDIKLTWKIAAIWMCDDGSNSLDRRLAELNTQSFTEDEVDFLVEKIESDLGVLARRDHKRGLPTIKITSDAWHFFIEGIKPYLPHECMGYKFING